jgi:hypothetical protein
MSARFARRRFEIALQRHLEFMHHPPYGPQFVGAAEAALEAAHDGAWSREVKMPDGRRVTAVEAFDLFHLDDFKEPGH